MLSFRPTVAAMLTREKPLARAGICIQPTWIWEGGVMLRPIQQDEACEIWNADSVEFLSALPDASCQCVVTSPPYDKLRTYKGSAQWNFEATAQELYRVLCEGGICCWNVGDQVIDGSETLTSFRQAIYFRDKCGFSVHDTMIYGKSNGANPGQVRYDQCFEYVFILTKGKPRCFNPIRDKRNITAGITRYGKRTSRRADGSMKERERPVAAEFGVRSNIWFGNTAGQENVCEPLPHPAMMPKWLARDLIISWSNPGDTIVDPFAGSGTTGAAALLLNRKAILNDNEPDYIPLIQAATMQRGLALA